MYDYTWDPETGGYLLTSTLAMVSREPRPVYYKELDLLGFDKYWEYERNDSVPYMWAEASSYFYRGHLIAKVKGGSLYTPPELVAMSDIPNLPCRLQPVNIPRMVEKNAEMLASLSQATIKKIYNQYLQYKENVEAFYVAYSGGKDSVVVLDLVQRALPHQAFKVFFGDTDMELPTTYELVEKEAIRCQKEGIAFYKAKAQRSAMQAWRLFGPPARRLRWCCTVHKTAPVIALLRELYEGKAVRSMMITGVRGGESVSRAAYDEISQGKKLAGQYSFHPLLNWTSAEIFLYIYAHELPLNDAYKRGFNRVGCIMCPNSSEKNEYIKRQNFQDLVDKYTDIIVGTSSKDLGGKSAQSFMECGGWKTRLSGRELKFAEPDRVSVTHEEGRITIELKKNAPTWREWYKTVGNIIGEGNHFYLEYKSAIYSVKHDAEKTFEIELPERNKDAIEFISLLKCVFIKSQYCISCRACEVECPRGNIDMKHGLVISDDCSHCHACLKIKNACFYYNSIKGSKDMKTLRGINRYLSVGVDANWIRGYFLDDNFEPGNRKTDVMFGFLADAMVTAKRRMTLFGELISRIGLESDTSWALMLCNLVYTPAFNWFVSNIPYGEKYTPEQLRADMGDAATDKAKAEFWNGMKVILDSNPAWARIGLGEAEVQRKETKTDVKKTLLSIYRRAWANPDGRVILYSLYKFAEACGGYYQFSLKHLMDMQVESDGVSPARIFGISEQEMKAILNGLASNYPEFINVSFTHDLDSISLSQEKAARDVLELFE